MERWYSSGFLDGSSFASSSNDSCFPLPWPSLPPASNSTAFQFNGLSSFSMAIQEVGEDGGASASKTKSHSLAEKRRRDRINAQLATLRKLVPKSDKMDKAALLGSVVDHVKDLERKAVEVSKVTTVPTDDDEVTIDCEIGQTDKNKKKTFIKVSVCCADRPELFSEIIRVVKGQRLRAVKADMGCVGGRIKSIFVLCAVDGEEGICLNALRHSLKLVLSRIASPFSQSGCRLRSKRPRFFPP